MKMRACKFGRVSRLFWHYPNLDQPLSESVRPIVPKQSTTRPNLQAHIFMASTLISLCSFIFQQYRQFRGWKGLLNFFDWYFLFDVTWPNIAICPSSSFSSNRFLINPTFDLTRRNMEICPSCSFPANKFYGSIKGLWVRRTILILNT